MKLAGLSFIALLALPSAVAAQTDAVDALVRDFIKQKNIPAAAIAVVHHGRVVKTAGYGVADVELNVHATEHSVFEIGSITKQFTAQVVMMLVDEGKLRLDDSLTRFLSDLPREWSGIRIRHLLTHTSGLHDWERDTTLSFWREYTTAEFVALVARRPLDFAPGSRFGYTNSAYPLLGKVVEQLTGMPYERVVMERIFRTAGMVETRFRDNRTLVLNRATGYADHGGQLVHGIPWRPAILTSNGGILSTATDMARWNIALSNGTLVKPATMAVMLTPTRFTDGSTFPGGIAWFTDTVRGHRVAVHNGSTMAGYSSVVYRYLDADLSVVVLFNIDRFDAVNTLATQIASHYLPALAK